MNHTAATANPSAAAYTATTRPIGQRDFPDASVMAWPKAGWRVRAR